MKYRKKPVVIEAVQFTYPPTEEFKRFINSGGSRTVNIESNFAQIETLEGTMTADIGDYIIKGIKGEFYPCKPDIFEQTYDCEHGKGLTDYCQPCGRIHAP
jgi:hypothetical protein